MQRIGQGDSRLLFANGSKNRGQSPYFGANVSHRVRPKIVVAENAFACLLENRVVKDG